MSGQSINNIIGCCRWFPANRKPDAETTLKLQETLLTQGKRPQYTVRRNTRVEWFYCNGWDDYLGFVHYTNDGQNNLVTDNINEV